MIEEIMAAYLQKKKDQIIKIVMAWKEGRVMESNSHF